MTTATHDPILLRCGHFGVWSGGQLLFQDRRPYITLAQPAKKLLAFAEVWASTPSVLDTASDTVTTLRVFRWIESATSENFFTEELTRAGFRRQQTPVRHEHGVIMLRRP